MLGASKVNPDLLVSFLSLRSQVKGQRVRGAISDTPSPSLMQSPSSGPLSALLESTSTKHGRVFVSLFISLLSGPS